ncbi:MAG: phenylalanine--tRNA ligase subunit beta, partial [Pseudomonadota bacterium]
DFAFLVDDAIPAGELAKAAQGADKTLIAGVDVFDVYAGKGVPDGQKSIALEVTFQPTGESLKDSDIDALMKAVIAAVEKKTGATLRG